MLCSATRLAVTVVAVDQVYVSITKSEWQCPLPEGMCASLPKVGQKIPGQLDGREGAVLEYSHDVKVGMC
jgi:hypothetical protein